MTNNMTRQISPFTRNINEVQREIKLKKRKKEKKSVLYYRRNNERDIGSLIW